MDVNPPPLDIGGSPQPTDTNSASTSNSPSELSSPPPTNEQERDGLRRSTRVTNKKTYLDANSTLSMMLQGSTVLDNCKTVAKRSTLSEDNDDIEYGKPAKKKSRSRKGKAQSTNKHMAGGCRKMKKSQKVNIEREKETGYGGWRDIPDWGDRADCPLFRLCDEVLDLCFGSNQDLSIRDYVALAGTCRFFRFSLNDNVWKEILWQHDDSTRCEKAGTSEGYKIFSRGIEDWRVDSSRIIGPENKPKGYWYPRAEKRDDWTKAEYVIYKSEQFIWRHQQKKESRTVTADYAKTASKARDRWIKSGEIPCPRYIYVGSSFRPVLSKFKGTKTIDENQIDSSKPASNQDTQMRDTSQIKSQGTSETLARNNSVTASQETGSQVPEEPTHILSIAEITRSLPPEDDWHTPDSEYGSDKEPDIKWSDVTGQRVPWDHYPSDHRKEAVEELEDHIFTKDAIREFKISKAELDPLDYVLPGSVRGRRSAAVEALAIRLHGGWDGHQAVLREAKDRAVKAGRAKQ
ncbi:uncharacterized protein IL334_000326 [Kwoniella shivajii]|uniref:F-box domain-containing protein n=1 Tax=Kwoniella shivajii TaxID=564305 RepID=A0ABZ1CP58_9TREE|nr:hypothetical protein IL334_000326 [Kwoniella shivajii]